jgi:formylglycine-generating enzyme required for sulfatase activity
MRSGLFSILFVCLATSTTIAKPLDIFRDCDVCPEMVELPLGEFLMGAREGEWLHRIIFYDGKYHPVTPERPYRKEDELPQHKVTVDIPIAMAKTEITYGDWMACVNDSGCGGYVPPRDAGQWGSEEAILRSATDPNLPHIASDEAIAKAIIQDHLLVIADDYPVIYVSYLDAQAYVAWLNKKFGTDAYRLPTEAEWEYAARAGTTTRFAQGEFLTSEQENFSGELTEFYMQEKRPDLRTRGYPVPVGALDAANPWGLRHMGGNVSEWTLSCYRPRIEGWATTREWLDRSVGVSCERTVRGGSYGAGMSQARAAHRSSVDQDWRTTGDGFRIVKELK